MEISDDPMYALAYRKSRRDHIAAIIFANLITENKEMWDYNETAKKSSYDLAREAINYADDLLSAMGD